MTQFKYNGDVAYDNTYERKDYRNRTAAWRRVERVACALYAEYARTCIAWQPAWLQLDAGQRDSWYAVAEASLCVTCDPETTLSMCAMCEARLDATVAHEEHKHRLRGTS